MFFNSIDFAIFLPLVFIIYWIVSGKNIKLQNIIVAIASYIFYGWWDYRFLALILFSTLVDYAIGISIHKQEDRLKRKLLLYISIITNIGFLGFFKYYNFFVDNFCLAFTFFGSEIKANSLNIILPVGISFYTFQTLSYTIDVYRKKLTPTHDFIAFASFVSFFPQLVAGPIERATNLLPQFYTKRKFDYSKAVDGMRQILWGLFKKMVIADNCAEVANTIFNNSADYSGSTLVLGAIFFAIQIYCDFSGYSDIAIGTARLFGFSLMQNFKFPYFSRDIAEFWRRWHISLSTWFRDYIYIPLGGSKCGIVTKIRNTFIIFIISGFWHGANWTFIIWGALNAIFFLPLMLTDRNRKNTNTVAENKLFPSIREIGAILLTFGLTTFAWIFFRAENIEHAYDYIYSIFSPTLFMFPEVFPIKTILLVIFFVALEWLGRNGQYAISDLGKTWKPIFRYAFYYAIVFAIFLFKGSNQEFIYFQF